MAGKRQRVSEEGSSAANGSQNGHANGQTNSSTYQAPDSLNDQSDRIKFAYWVPNVSGGLVISKIPQKTSWDYESNVRYAQTAEDVGFEFALTQIRFMSGYGAENQHESLSFSQALLHRTKKINVIAALLPGPWNPTIAAKAVASISHYTGGRISVNVVSGWFKGEFTAIGQWWLEHAERYRRSKEFIQCLRGIWTTPNFDFRGDFYQYHDYNLSPKPYVHEQDKEQGRSHPIIFQGGNSVDARQNGAEVSDYYFMNGAPLAFLQEQIADVKARAKAFGRGTPEIKFALNGFAIVRETEEEAIQVLSAIQGQADKEAVEAFQASVKQAGASSSEKKGMWADSKFEDLVQYNDGFKTKLIGTKDQVVDRILLLKSLGIDVLLVAFLHYEDEIELFGEQVIARVRELEGQGRGRDVDDEIKRTGAVYGAK